MRLVLESLHWLVTPFAWPYLWLDEYLWPPYRHPPGQSYGDLKAYIETLEGELALYKRDYGDFRKSESFQWRPTRIDLH